MQHPSGSRIYPRPRGEEVSNVKVLSDDEYQEFMKTVGMCEFMDLPAFLKSAEVLVAADEPMRALSLLDNLPAYYRDNQPKEVVALKNDIYSLLATPAFYAQNPYDELVRTENAVATINSTLRGQIIVKDVKEYNERGITPHLIDLGPGEYWLPIGLKQLGFQFTYRDIGLSGRARQLAMEHIGERVCMETPTDRPVIFVACELIEHLHHEADIAVDFHRVKANADIIHLSTPKYTYGTQSTQYDWRKKGDLGHLRTYTPREFSDAACRMFPKYQFALYDSHILHLRGTRSK